MSDQEYAFIVVFMGVVGLFSLMRDKLLLGLICLGIALMALVGIFFT